MRPGRGSGVLREGATYPPACPALCLPSPPLRPPVLLSVPARPHSWKWDGKSQTSPQSRGARPLSNQKQHQHLAVTPAAATGTGALWPRGAFLPQPGSTCAFCARSRAQKQGKTLTKMKVQGKKRSPAEATGPAQAGSILLLPAAGGEEGRAFVRGLPLLPGMLPACFLAA